MRIQTQQGFTIVELLIVVVVIAILAAITIVSYRGITTAAQVSAVTSGLKQVDKSMRLWMTDSGATQWPTDPVAGGGVPLSTMINDNPGLQQYLQTVPSVQGVQTSEWFYDNEGDVRTNCTNPLSGVNIVVRYVNNQDLAQKVDNSLDDGVLTCGKVRYVNGVLLYSLSYDQTVMN